jgi:hypothetical protein
MPKTSQRSLVGLDRLPDRDNTGLVHSVRWHLGSLLAIKRKPDVRAKMLCPFLLGLTINQKNVAVSAIRLALVLAHGLTPMF